MDEAKQAKTMKRRDPARMFQRSRGRESTYRRIDRALRRTSDLIAYAAGAGAAGAALAGAGGFVAASAGMVALIAATRLVSRRRSSAQ
jgi:hypothetical protein